MIAKHVENSLAKEVTHPPVAAADTKLTSTISEACSVTWEVRIKETAEE